MSDLIRRQDVLKICDKYNGQGWVWSMIRKEVEELPCDGCCTAHSGYEADAISRQDVLDLAKKGVLVSNGNYKSVCKAINELPSVNPQPCEDAISREDALMCLTGEIKETDTIETIIARFVRRIRKLPSVNSTKTGWIPVSEKYEHHIDHTDCIWYGNDSGCPVTCSQYRDGWNDAMDYIFKNGDGYRPYRRNENG